MATNHVPVPTTQAALSLLSLSSSESPQPASSAPALGRFVHAPRSSTAASVVRPVPPATNGTHKRRLSGAVQTRRRMSDAANAAASPVVVAPMKHGAAPGPSVGDLPVASGLPASIPTETDGPANGSANGKKKGQIFKCETCSKVYRHPNCLVKHRWEHSPHWREASKFLLSKHQQVQMLEAAAILSHISPQNGVGTSLPEDRSLWPAYLSGGLLPTPGSSVPTSTTTITSNPATHTHNHSDYREREQSVSTSAIDDQDESSGDEDDEREDSGYGSSSAMAVPGYQLRPSNNTAMSFGGHEYTISSSHAGCDAAAHLGSMRLSGMGRSISSSSFGMSSLRGGLGHDRDDDGMEEEPEEEQKQGLKWEDDVSMAMDMDL
ncbi:C2H2 zinc finger [Ceratobasidium sp. AG-Ba]|nr:C2H2 zinc finger [Ceratobasidium sp. AG-Ba]